LARISRRDPIRQQRRPKNRRRRDLMTTRRILKLGAAMAALALAGAASAQGPGYKLTKAVPLGAPDRWDYVVADPASHRVYVAHGTGVSVVDAASLTVVGTVDGMAGGTHGTGVAAWAGLGFTDDGRAGEADAFDLKTLKVTAKIPAGADADGVVADKVSGHVFVVDGDPGTVSVIDPKAGKLISTIAGGGKLETAIADGKGRLYVNGEEKRDMVVIDTRAGKVIAHWPMPNCQSPHGIAVDVAGHRLFSSCVNSQMMVLNTDTGQVVASVPIGRGSDAAGWDPTHKRAFSSNGFDGTVSVIQQKTPDSYEPLAPIQTVRSARTMAVDPSSGRLFVAGADVDPASPPGQRPRMVPGSLRLMVFDPAG
jgi:DNA-binding beta-propeller fold protein YncE